MQTILTWPLVCKFSVYCADVLVKLNVGIAWNCVGFVCVQFNKNKNICKPAVFVCVSRAHWICNQHVIIFLLHLMDLVFLQAGFLFHYSSFSSVHVHLRCCYFLLLHCGEKHSLKRLLHLSSGNTNIFFHVHVSFGVHTYPYLTETWKIIYRSLWNAMSSKCANNVCIFLCVRLIAWMCDCRVNGCAHSFLLYFRRRVWPEQNPGNGSNPMESTCIS